MVGLTRDRKRPLKEYSKGMRQRIGLAQALINDPDLVILDEPTSGLDPLLQHELLTLVEERVADGTTVFLSSHVLPEVERVAERVGILRRGALVSVGAIDDLRSLTRHRLDLHLSEPADATAFAALDGVVSAESLGNVVTLVVEGSVDAVIKHAAGHTVERIVSHESDLEDAFLDLYR